jgi:uncharacterized protein
MDRLSEPQWPTRVLVVMRATDHEARTHGHPWAATTPLLCKFLLDAGFEVELSNNLDRVKNPDPDNGLNQFDAVVLHGKFEQADDAAVAALKGFVHGGKGLMVIHIASASFAPSPDAVSAEWKELIGSVWVYAPEGDPRRSHHPEPPGPLTIRVENPRHPIMAGVPSEFRLAKEELYQNMLVADSGRGEAIATGMDARNATGGTEVTAEPVAFALERGRGRVFHLYLGHFISTHSDWRFQKMVTQGVEWAARR